jgi:hypothetical protein
MKTYFAESLPNPFMLGDMHPLVIISVLYDFGANLVRTFMEHPEVVKFMDRKEKFDICVIENFNADAFLVR